MSLGFAPLPIIADLDQRPVVSAAWRPVMRWSWTPVDAVEMAVLATFSAMVDPGTQGDIRLRVAESGAVTPPIPLLGLIESTRMPWLSADFVSTTANGGVTSVVLEARRTLGSGGVTVREAAATVAPAILAVSPPVFYSQPVIIGDAIPGGQVVSTIPNASGFPQPVVTYEWLVDGAVAPFATSRLFPIPLSGATTIQVRATATNASGTASVLSSLVYVQTDQVGVGFDPDDFDPDDFDTEGEIPDVPPDGEEPDEEVPLPAYSMEWDTTSGFPAPAPLASATLDVAKVYVRLVVPVDAPTITRVDWYADGSLIRENDIDPPYELRGAGFTFTDGPHNVTATVIYPDRTPQSVPISFTVSAMTALSFAGPGTVGHLVNGTTLTTHSGDYTATADIVLADLAITGNLVGASGMQGTNLNITKALKGSSNYAEPLQLNFSTIGPTSGQEGGSITTADLRRSVFGAKYTLNRCDIRGMVDGLFPTGNDITVTDSWIHGQYHMASDPYQAGEDSHCDCVQVWNGQNISLIRCRIDAFQWNAGDSFDEFNTGTWPHPSNDYNQAGQTRQTSAVIIACGGNGTNGPTSNVLMDGCRIAGYVGGHLINVGQANHNAVPTDVVIRNCVIDWRGILSDRKILGVDPRVTSLTWEGNVDHTGAPISLARATTTVGTAGWV